VEPDVSDEEVQQALDQESSDDEDSDEVPTLVEQVDDEEDEEDEEVEERRIPKNDEVSASITRRSFVNHC
jgi:hypothetical protein